MKTRIVLMIGLFGFLTVMTGYGQRSEITAKIDFPFTVEGQALPAGTYDFVRDETAPVFRVSDEGRNQALAQVQTRLAAELHAASADARIVFDKIGDTFVLSEIWIPGADGYALAITKGQHEHKVVNVKY